MKKWIIGLLFLASTGWAVTQAHNLGVVNIYVKSQTLAQIQASTPTAVGQVLFCSNCTANGGSGTLCISTATANAQTSFVLSTGTVCK